MNEDAQSNMAQRRWYKRPIVVGVICFLLGLMTAAGVRLLAYSPPHTHYHANFAVYINGQREQFKGTQYYEDVGVCSFDKAMTPKGRVHMHNNVSDTVHVHDEAATWRELFANLGWTVSGTSIETDKGAVYRSEGDGELTFVLNGKTQFTNIMNSVIGNEDKLLISYGSESNADLQKQFTAIASTAYKHNHAKDPATCSGHEFPTFTERLKHILN
jgi:hypothetical protein